MYQHRRQKEANLYCPRMLTSGNSAKLGSCLPQMTPITNQSRIWNSDDSMPMKEAARLANQPRKLFYDRVFDRHEVAIGWRSYKAMGSSKRYSPRQLYPTTLSKNALLSANEHSRNRHACHQRCPLLITILRKRRQRHSITARISQQLLDCPLSQY